MGKVCTAVLVVGDTGYACRYRVASTFVASSEAINCGCVLDSRSQNKLKIDVTQPFRDLKPEFPRWVGIAMDRVKIVYLVSTLGHTGPTIQLYNLISNLDHNTFDIVLVTLSPEPSSSLIDKFRDLNIQLISLNLTRMGSLILGIYRLRSILRSIQPEILHTQGLRADLLSSVLLENRNRITTQRNNPIEDYPELFRPVFGKVIAAAHNNAFKRIPYVVRCSKTLAESFQNGGPRAITIQNGVDLSRGQSILSFAEKLAIRKKLGIATAGKVFIFAGPLIPRKAPQMLINAFINLPTKLSFALYILGDGPLSGVCREAINKHKNIKMVGFVPNIDPYLMAADGYISASRSEGLSNALLEALAWGLPVILSDISSHREVLASNRLAGELFPTNDVAALRETICKFPFSHRASRCARSIVEHDFNANLMAKKYEKLYLGNL